VSRRFGDHSAKTAADPGPRSSQHGEVVPGRTEAATQPVWPGGATFDFTATREIEMGRDA